MSRTSTAPRGTLSSKKRSSCAGEAKPSPRRGDYHGESDQGQNPIATVFVRRNGAIHHFWSSELYWAPNDPGMHPRHVDFIWPLWSMLDCTPEGRGTDLFPKLAYR